MMSFYPSVTSHARALLLLLLLALSARGETYLAAPPSDAYVPEYGEVVPRSATDVLPLSGEWRMQIGDAAEQAVQVPGSWHTGLGEVALRRSFRIDPSLIGAHHRLIFWGLRPNAAVSLNGYLLRSTEGDWPTLTLDVPPELVDYDGENEIEVVFDDRLSARETIPLKPKLYDPAAYSGLVADVLLVSTPPLTIHDSRWTVALDSTGAADWRFSWRVRDHLAQMGDTLGSRPVEVSLRMFGPDGSELTAQAQKETVSLASLESVSGVFRGRMRRPALWTPSTPRLYTLEMTLNDGPRSLTVAHRVGVRSIDWESGSCRINGESIELRGIDLRLERPETGVAMTVEQIETDLSRIRNQGFNLVRVIGAPPHPAVPDICDRLGLFLLPQSGARGVPLSLLDDPAFSSRLTNLMRQMISATENHPSLLGWGVMDWASPDPMLIQFVQQLRMGLLPSGAPPLVVSFAADKGFDLPQGILGISQRVPYHLNERLAQHDRVAGTWLAGGLGALATPLVLDEDSLESQIRQSDALVRQINAVREMPVAGFVIDGYNDRRAALPLLLAGSQADPMVIRRGLVTDTRTERISWRRISDLMSQSRVDVPAAETLPTRFPVEFSLATLIVGGLLLLVMRQNNVFRQNLKRVYAHTHGFLTDIVERRYFQSGQTFFVALIVSATHGILLASLLNHSRYQMGLEYLITLVFPFVQVKSWLVYGAWHPVQAMLAATALVLLITSISAFLLRIVSLPFPGRMRLKHANALIIWASTCFLPLIPLGLVYYRLLEYDWFQQIQTVFFLVFWFWFLVRLASVIRVGFRVSQRSAWVLILLFIATAVGGFWTLYLSGFAIMDYVRFYADVIRPWLEGASV